MKVVMETNKGKVLVGVQKDKVDPFLTAVEGTMPEALAAVPGIIDSAEEHWKATPRNPAYKAPVEVKAAADKPVEKPAEKSKEPVKPDEKPKRKRNPGFLKKSAVDDVLAKVQDPAAPLVETPSPAVLEEAAAPVIATEDPKAPDIPALEEKPAAIEEPPAANETENMPENILPAEIVNEAAAEAIPANNPIIKPELQEAIMPPTRPYNNRGNFEYMLNDGRGPYADINAVLDALGFDKEIRPKHNRYDKLSATLKALFIRREKPGTPSAILSNVSNMVDRVLEIPPGLCEWHRDLGEASLPMQLGDRCCSKCNRWYRFTGITAQS